MTNEKDFIITLDIDRQEIKAFYDRDEVYSGIIGYLRIKANFINWGEDNTVFRFTYGENKPYDVIYTDEPVLVPKEVINAPGFTVAVGGYKTEEEDLERFIPTNSAFIPVKKNGYGRPDVSMGEIEDAKSLQGQLIEIANSGKAEAERSAENANMKASLAEEKALKADAAADRVDDTILASEIATKEALAAKEKANIAAAYAHRAAEEVDNYVSDIGIALENIIAIQKSLIVGNRKTSFVDRITNKTYDLYVSDGKLMIEESEG